MTTKAKAPTALEVEQRCAAEMERGRRLGAEAEGEAARAQRAFEQAEAERDAALEAQVRGETDADDRLSVALAAIREAAERVAVARQQSEASRRVYTQAEARQRQVRASLVDELAEDAERLVADAVAARDALEEPLKAYLSAYRTVERRWRQLYAGCREKVAEADRVRGHDRDDMLVAREATCPAAPIDADMIVKVLATEPRPPVMSEGYRPGMAPEQYGTEPEQSPFLFAGDVGHETHTLGEEEDGPIEIIGATTPPTPKDFDMAALRRATR